MAATPTPLRAFTLTALTLTALCWLTALLASVFHWPEPFRWPLFPRGSHYYDLVVYLDRFTLLHTPAFFTAPGFPFSYFAPGVFPYRFLYLFGKLGGFLVYLALSAGSVAAGALLLRRALIRRRCPSRGATLFVLTAALTSFPILFCLERGNIEILLSIGVALGLWAFCTGRPALAAALWGAFGSVKLYPLILLALFFHRGQLRYAALTIASAAVTTVAALWYIGPSVSFALRGLQHGTALFLANYTLSLRAQPWDHSLFSLTKLFVSPASLPHLLRWYLPGMAVLMLAVYLVRIRRLPLPNQVLLLSLSAVLLPPTSYAYTLTGLYGALAVLAITSVTSDRPSHTRALTAIMALLAAAMCPFNLVQWHGHGIEGQENCLILLTTFLIALVYPLQGNAIEPQLHDAA